MQGNLEEQILKHWVWEVRYRLFEESTPRIIQCLVLLSEKEVWQRPNDYLSSIGNLVLHLNGNVTQYILHGIGGQQDNRIREQEFTADGSHTKAELKNLLEDLKCQTEKALDRLEPADLVKKFEIQGFILTGIGVLTHAIEHFSYHTGQITWYTKMLHNVDLGYYAEMDLETKG